MKFSNLGLAVCVALIAVPFGSGMYTFFYADGFSYLSKNPAACANCHVMRDTFDDWSKGSHARVAVCVDCHLPRDFVGKWYTKAENGFAHSLMMTLGRFDNIRARPVSKRIALDNCLHCHDSLVNHFNQSGLADDAALDCTSCHRSAGHSH